jgi:hypothetical protein
MHDLHFDGEFRLNRDFKLQLTRSPLLLADQKHSAPFFLPAPSLTVRGYLASVQSRFEQVKIDQAGFWLRLHPIVSNVAQTRKAPAVIMYSTRCSAMSTGDSICFGQFL